MRATSEQINRPTLWPDRKNLAALQKSHRLHGRNPNAGDVDHDPNANDWSFHADGQAIGRLYEDSSPSRPELAWF
jgi:hypothetical protein